MEKQKKSFGTIALVVLLLVVTVVSLILATYAWAKYQSNITNVNSATAVVAKWDPSASVDGEATWAHTYTHVVSTKMAPGTSGVIPITVELGTSDVCADYEVFVTGIQNKPTHLRFCEATRNGTEGNYTYTKKAGTEKSNISGDVTGYATGSYSIFTGNLGLTGETGAVQTETRYLMWEWPYSDPNPTDPITDVNPANGVSDYDDIDTAEGQDPKTMTVTFRVLMTQVQPDGSHQSKN